MPNEARNFSWEYDQAAVVANVDFHDHVSNDVNNETGWQRFLSTGPVALLPLTMTKSNLIWSTTRREAKRLMALSDEDFVNAVNDAFVTADEENRSAVVDAVMNFSRTVLETNPLRSVSPSIIFMFFLKKFFAEVRRFPG